MDKEILITFLAIAFLLPLLISPESISAIDLNDEKFKVVVTFELNQNPNVIRGQYQQDVVPQMNDIFDDLGLNTFDKTGEGQPNNPFGYSAEIHAVSFHVAGTNPQQENIFQIYPLVRVTGDKPDLTQADYDLAVDLTVAQMRTAIVDFLQAEGATNVKSYIHFSFGGVHLDEGF